MTVYDPEALARVQDIYREVMLSASSLELSAPDRDKIAQEILRLVASGRCDRDEILAVVRSQIERWHAADRSAPDCHPSAKRNSD